MSAPARTAALGAVVIGVIGVVALGASAARAGATTVLAPFGPETWYQPNPACATPVGCTTAAPPAMNPYGAGTLHVAASAGTETASSYLAVGRVATPAGATLTAAALTIPLDTATTGNGSSMPDTATLQVCPATGTITANEGEFDAPPTTSCMERVQLAYTSTPVPAFRADVSALIPSLNAGLADGTALLGVLPSAPSPTASWHVVFSSDDRPQPPTPAPTLALTYATAGVAAPVVVTSAPAAVVPSAAASGRLSAASAAPLATSTRVARPSPSPAGTTTGGAGVTTAPTAVDPAGMGAVGSVGVVPPLAGGTLGIVPGVPAPSLGAGPSGGSSAPAAGAVVPAEPATVESVAGAATVAARQPSGFAYPVVLLVPFGLVGLGVVLARVMTGDVSRLSPDSRL